MKKINLLLVCLLLVLSPMEMIAQETQVKNLVLKQSFDDFITTLKQNIAIDPDGYNVSIDYIDTKSKIVVVSGTANEKIPIIAQTFNIVRCRQSFQFVIQQLSNGDWQLKQNKMIYSFKGSYGSFSGLSYDILKKIEAELELIAQYNNEIEIDEIFLSNMEKLSLEVENHQQILNNPKLKKKERQAAQYKYNVSKAEYDFHSAIKTNYNYLTTHFRLNYLYK